MWWLLQIKIYATETRVNFTTSKISTVKWGKKYIKIIQKYDPKKHEICMKSCEYFTSASIIAFAWALFSVFYWESRRVCLEGLRDFLRRLLTLFCFIQNYNKKMLRFKYKKKRKEKGCSRVVFLFLRWF